MVLDSVEGFGIFGVNHHFIINGLLAPVEMKGCQSVALDMFRGVEKRPMEVKGSGSAFFLRI